MQKLLTLILILNSAFCIHNSSAQSYQWAHGFGGPNNNAQGNSIATDAMGNVYVTGTFGDSIDFDPGAGFDTLAGNGENMFVAKYDSSGAYKWAITTEGLGTSQGKRIALDATGVYVVGNFSGIQDFDPGVGVHNLQSNNGSTDFFIAKFDLNGNYIWAFSIGGTGIDAVYDIVLDNLSNLYITGSFQDVVDFDPSGTSSNLTSHGWGDVFIAKYDLNGSFIFAKGFGGTAASYGWALAVNSLHEIFLTGLFDDSVDFDPGFGVTNLFAGNTPDVFVAKYDSTGNLIHVGAIAVTNFSTALGYPPNVTLSADEEFLYLGSHFKGIVDFDLDTTGVFNLDSQQGPDAYFGKYDTSGALIWVKSFGGLTPQSTCAVANTVLEPLTGNLIIVGSFRNTIDFDPDGGVLNLSANGTNSDIYFAKLDSNGSLIWVRQMGATGIDAGIDIALGSINNDVYLTGLFQSQCDFDPDTASSALLNTGTFKSSIFIAKYSNTLTSVKQHDNYPISLSSYPNPANKIINISFSDDNLIKSTNLKLEVYDNMGKKVLTSEVISNPYKIDISKLTSGIYFIKIYSRECILSSKFNKL